VRSLWIVLIALTVGTALSLARPNATFAAAYETGAYHIVSPMGGVARYVTSPPQFHDGCEPYTSSYYDSPKFDDGSCSPGLSPTSGQWALDMQGSDNDFVYIDINPGAIDGVQAGTTYRIVAGTQGSWGGVNGGYQYFGIHTWNPSILVWENYAWIALGHIDNMVYTSGAVIAGPTTSRATVIIGQIAPQGTWAEHLHVEVSNNFAAHTTHDRKTGMDRRILTTRYWGSL